MANRTPHPIDQRIGVNLRTARHLRGLTQAALAEKMNPPVTMQQISKYEDGIDRISGRTLYSMSQALGIAVQDFFDGIADMLPEGEGALHLSRQEGELVHAFRKVDRETKSAVIRLVGAVSIQMAEKFKGKRTS